MRGSLTPTFYGSRVWAAPGVRGVTPGGIGSRPRPSPPVRTLFGWDGGNLVPVGARLRRTASRPRGVRWDGARRIWYALPETNPEPLASWLPSEMEAPCHSGVDGAETLPQKWVSLATFLARNRPAVSRALPQAEWVRAEKNGNLYPELVEQNDRGVILAQARGFVWRLTSPPSSSRPEVGPLRPGIKVSDGAWGQLRYPLAWDGRPRPVTPAGARGRSAPSRPRRRALWDRCRSRRGGPPTRHGPRREPSSAPPGCCRGRPGSACG
jgi:hypothetical protein